MIDPVLAYSTYLGGGVINQGLGIAVDGAGNAYVTGYTNSNNFPIANPSAGQQRRQWLRRGLTRLTRRLAVTWDLDFTFHEPPPDCVNLL